MTQKFITIIMALIRAFWVVVRINAQTDFTMTYFECMLKLLYYNGENWYNEGNHLHRLNWVVRSDVDKQMALRDHWFRWISGLMCVPKYNKTNGQYHWILHILKMKAKTKNCYWENDKFEGIKRDLAPK